VGPERISEDSEEDALIGLDVSFKVGAGDGLLVIVPSDGLDGTVKVGAGKGLSVIIASEVSAIVGAVEVGAVEVGDGVFGSGIGLSVFTLFSGCCCSVAADIVLFAKCSAISVV